jgi:glycosyltransferase involved in cell wall biosynthesis
VEEAVADGVGGLLVPEDAGAFADAMLAVAGDPGLAAKLSDGARETAGRFAAPALAERLAALYARLAGDRP